MKKRESSIHGIGIFTEQDIKKNTVFYEVPMELISNEPKERWAYIGKNRWVSDEKVLNCINHSCCSNSRLDISDLPKLIAQRDIKAGEEITVDYNKTEKSGKKVLCNCKSKKCRKYFLRIENIKPKIGILGGIGPESSALFYEQLVKLVQFTNINSNTEYPHIILESIPAPELLLKNPDLSMYKKALKNLQKAGADFIVIICNTAYIFIDQFENIVDIPIMDLSKETKKSLDKNNLKKITIFGSKKTINKLFHFESIEIESINEDDSKIIDKMILDYNSGKNKKELEQRLINLIKKYPQKNILIACTELSTMLKNSGLKYLDTFDILLNATFNKWKNS